MRERIYVGVAVAAAAGLFIGCLWASTIGGPVRPGGAEARGAPFVAEGGNELCQLVSLSFAPKGQHEGRRPASRLWHLSAPKLPLRLRYYLARDPLEKALLWLSLHQEGAAVYLGWHYVPEQDTSLSVSRPLISANASPAENGD